MSLRVCALAWRRGWLCTTSRSGSTINSVDLVWPSPTYWDGELTIHTKRYKRGPFGPLRSLALRAILDPENSRARKNYLQTYIVST